MSRTELPISLFLIPIVMLFATSASAQPLLDRPQTQDELPAFLKAPPKSLLRAGLQPLSAELPDTDLPEGLQPPDASQGIFDQIDRVPANFRGGEWASIHYPWYASGLRYRPLYFEDAMLERHGQVRHPLIQPLASGTRFFATFPALPYAMVVNPPRPAISALGHFRPGECAPLLLQRPPLQKDAGIVEAVVIVGLICLIP